MDKRLAGILLFFSVVIFLAGCSMPIGSIYDKADRGQSEHYFMWLVPHRIMYEIDAPLMRYSDYQIFIADHGEVFSWPTDDQGIRFRIIFNENQSTQRIYDTHPDGLDPLRETDISVYNSTGRIPLHIIGTAKVEVEFLPGHEHETLSSHYGIEIFSRNNGGGGLDGDGIGIIWLGD